MREYISPKVSYTYIYKGTTSIGSEFYGKKTVTIAGETVKVKWNAKKDKSKN